MKKNPLKEKTPAELLKMLGEKREELRAYRFASVGARPKDTNQGAKLRKEIARILTELALRKKVAA
ncbi:MAG: ribosomal protein L29 [Parcubacteria bacterium C7867-001]|nr:MAG: ribosomal protein L29 [Parcubacteria bacterium C7867-001]